MEQGTLVLVALIGQTVRAVVATVVGVLAIVCLLDWFVRTRRINAFNPLARFLRQTVNPLLAPMERRVVRAGGVPSSAPLWTLAIAVVVGIVLISTADFLINQLIGAWFAATSGPAGIFVLIVQWTFLLLRVALIVRVIVSWLPISSYSKWVRWSFRLSEPILRPLRSIVPSLGAFDVTPIVAYFLLTFIEWALLNFRI